MLPTNTIQDTNFVYIHLIKKRKHFVLCTLPPYIEIILQSCFSKTSGSISRLDLTNKKRSTSIQKATTTVAFRIKQVYLMTKCSLLNNTNGKHSARSADKPLVNIKNMFGDR